MTPEIRAEIANLRAEVSSQALQIAETASPVMMEMPPDLAQGDQQYELDFELIYESTNSYTHARKAMTVAPSWNEIFSAVGPTLYNEATREEISEALGQAIAMHIDDVQQNLPTNYDKFIGYDVYDAAVDDVVVQFVALNLIEPGTKKRTITDKSKYWCLTLLGRLMLMKLRAIRKEDAYVPAQVDLVE